MTEAKKPESPPEDQKKSEEDFYCHPRVPYPRTLAELLEKMKVKKKEEPL